MLVTELCVDIDLGNFSDTIIKSSVFSFKYSVVKINQWVVASCDAIMSFNLLRSCIINCSCISFLDLKFLSTLIIRMQLSKVQNMNIQSI